MPECLQVASMGSAESMLLSPGSAESMMLSAGDTESMMLSDTLSTGTENAESESIILSVAPSENMIMILLALFDCVIMLTAVATKKTTVGNTNECRLTTLVNRPPWRCRLVCRQRLLSFATLQTYC
jgi:hypothetical protein